VRWWNTLLHDVWRGRKVLRYDENAPEYEWIYDLQQAEQNLDLDFVLLVAVIVAFIAIMLS
jgi:hypothetical protein